MSLRRHPLMWLVIALMSLGLTVITAQISLAQAAAIQAEVVFTLTDLGGAEMLDVSSDGSLAVVAGGETATVVNILSDRLTVAQTWTLTEEYFPEGSAAAEITGVSVSPDDSYALVGVKDNDEANLATFDEVPGKVVALSIPDLTVLGQVTVGRGPDSVAIAPNGLFAAVANEDEENEEDLTNPANRPGTVSIIDLSNGPSSMTQVEIPLPPDGIPFFPNDPQPETIRIAADNSFLLATLQENNAVARIEVPSPLPSPLDASAFTVTNFDMGIRTGLGLTEDRAGEGICRSSSYDPSLRQEYTAAREPDGIALSPDLSFFVTADEDNLTGVNEQSYEGILMSLHGTRSVSVFDAQTGALLSDSGDTIEDSVIALQLPQRCSSKGPEPEVVSIGEVGGRVLAFVAIERSDAVTIHDVTDPRNIELLDTVILNPNVVAADIAAELEPEGIEFIPQTNQVVVSNPEGGSMSLINLTVQ
ncbi:choice-of-anchor I domain-containing protein [Egbenema bharatensis]|uniref:choice-of-anchor I domain-containing protein n=1 Tax=Egbenema bharatensis TaxID=3463334 RepID=UPI003A887F38